jgi:hypothetical protein
MIRKTTLIPTQLFVGSQEILEGKTEEFLQQVFCKDNPSRRRFAPQGKREGYYCNNCDLSPTNSEYLQNSKKDCSCNNSIPLPVRPEEERSDVSKDCYCNNCRKIKNQQHESIIFINPEKDYTLKDIEIIFEKINFALDEDQYFFFILQKAQTLNLACANKLLKVLEEPPTGYNFILHTNNTNSILPTILSRCHIINFSNIDDTTQVDHPLLSFFYKQNLYNPAEFEKELRKQALTDSQSIELANNLMTFFAKKIIDHHKKIKNSPIPVRPDGSTGSPRTGSNGLSEIKQLQRTYEYLKRAMLKPPQSGSSNLFWKNLYLTFPKN